MKLMTDLGVLSECIPGCKELREMKLDEYWFQLTYGYDGTLRVGKISWPLYNETLESRNIEVRLI
jgi:carbon monoxide dehydrogenase subunit G